ncbi:heme lyase CcmF/NrfE family subunit [Candidatus Legionella polyplacis]|uniref:Heme lyase CcmF/NrfE family subunit n=1 Tax=Candidatus Legionella polyplacis TaxID=2005262 RepID=A0ABZ2GW14_9GAMM
MIVNIGLFFLFIALIFSILIVIVPIFKIWKENKIFLGKIIFLYARMQFLFVFFSYLCLILCFLKNDFTVTYVLTNSSIYLPWFYKVCAVWSGHEGSMLFWIVVLSFWMLIISYFSMGFELVNRIYSLVVLGFLSIGFFVFLLLESNPFERQFFLNFSNGFDLNPILQDIGFLLHPPILYIGYVGFSVVFSFVMSILFFKRNRKEIFWWKLIRPLVLFSWCFLTIGIILGSWWAYRELGWGGWWFWDPVENISLMPWLISTALLHSLLVDEKKKYLSIRSILLVVVSFFLSLIGTFLVRSGILISVHSFSIDPKKSFYILCFFFLLVSCFLIFFSLKIKRLLFSNKRDVSFSFYEKMLLLNNILLITCTMTIFLGTIYPIIIDVLGYGRISVGAPYFNTMFSFLILPLILIMSFGINLCFYNNFLIKKKCNFRYIICVSFFISFIFLYLFFGVIKIYALLGISLSFCMILNLLQLVLVRINKYYSNKEKIRASFFGMIVSHFGISIMLIGIVLSSVYKNQEIVSMNLKDIIYFSGYKIYFSDELPLYGPNYHGIKAQFLIYNKKNNYVKNIYSEKRIYNVNRMVKSIAGIDKNFFRDIYITLGDSISDKEWIIYFYYEPFIRWIWFGGILIFCGGLFGLIIPYLLNFDKKKLCSYVRKVLRS